MWHILDPQPLVRKCHAWFIAAGRHSHSIEGWNKCWIDAENPHAKFLRHYSGSVVRNIQLRLYSDIFSEYKRRKGYMCLFLMLHIYKETLKSTFKGITLFSVHFLLGWCRRSNLHLLSKWSYVWMQAPTWYNCDNG